MKGAWTLVLLMGLCAGLRPGAPEMVKVPTAFGPHLPASAGGHAGVPLPMGPSEALLAGMPGVSLERMAYGASQVGLVNARGLRENHPPAVCLRAGGFEVMDRAEEQRGGSCLVHLKVRRQGRTSHYYFSYITAAQGNARGTCGYWTELAGATWRRLTGRPGTWSTVQVMDSDPARARTLLTELIRRIK